MTEVTTLWRSQEDRPLSYAFITVFKFISLALVSSKTELPALSTVLLLMSRIGTSGLVDDYIDEPLMV